MEGGTNRLRRALASRYMQWHEPSIVFGVDVRPLTQETPDFLCLSRVMDWQKSKSDEHVKDTRIKQGHVVRSTRISRQQYYTSTSFSPAAECRSVHGILEVRSNNKFNIKLFFQKTKKVRCVEKKSFQ